MSAGPCCSRYRRHLHQVSDADSAVSTTSSPHLCPPSEEANTTRIPDLDQATRFVGRVKEADEPFEVGEGRGLFAEGVNNQDGKGSRESVCLNNCRSGAMEELVADFLREFAPKPENRFIRYERRSTLPADVLRGGRP